MNLKGIILTSLIGLCFILVGIIFFSGKGTSIFRGPRGVIKPRFNPEVLCKLTGVCFFVQGGTSIIIGLTLSFGVTWLFHICIGILCVCLILMSILFKINKYFG